MSASISYFDVEETVKPKLLTRLDDSAVPEPNTGCWLWTGYTEGGYGRLGLGRAFYLRVHRLSYEAAYGPIPSGFHIDHKCRHTTCVNPDHLEAVSNAENQRRRCVTTGKGTSRDRRDTGERWRATHCRRGHALSQENVTVLSRGERRCKLCHSMRQAERRKRV